MNGLPGFPRQFPLARFLAMGLPALLGVLIVSPAALAHEQTRVAYAASLNPAESQRLAAAASLKEPRPTGVGELCRVRLRLVDGESRRVLPGLLRIRREGGALVPLPGLLNRGVRLPEQHPGRQWHVTAGDEETFLPRERLTLEAVAGIESEISRQELDLRGKAEAELVIPVRRFSSLARDEWRAGNTHLHLEGITREQADEYLRLVPAADGVDLVFVSHLSQARPDEAGRRSDLAYISNTYTAEQLHGMSTPRVQFGWGEEMRHAFPGDAYGHVMLLNLTRLIEPVSIGWSLNLTGPDYPPLRTGIDAARREGATVIWCHYERGVESLPNFVGGRIHALNMFDSQRPGDYSGRYYQLLNLGLSVPFSTGTDWFISDFARVHARVPGNATRASWLAAVAAGRTFITNGTLLELRAGEHQVGDTIAIAAPTRMTFSGRAAGRNDFTGIDLVHNGRVVARADSRRDGGHYSAELSVALSIAEPGWVALRVRNGSFDTDQHALPFGNIPVYGLGPGFNEMGMRLFGHTSPIYFEFAARRRFDADTARSTITEIDEGVRHLRQHARFENDAQRDEVFRNYAEATDWLRQRIRDAAATRP